jgi:hypothetical protein
MTAPLMIGAIFCMRFENCFLQYLEWIYIAGQWLRVWLGAPATAAAGNPILFSFLGRPVIVIQH